MNFKKAPIMVALLLFFSVGSVNFSLGEEVIASNSEVEGVAVNGVDKDVEKNRTIMINDPVATYNGIPISKEEFLDYMEGQTGMRTEEFYDLESLEMGIKSYLQQKYKVSKAKEIGLLDSTENKLDIALISQILLASMVEREELLSGETITDRASKLESPSLRELQSFVRLTSPSTDFSDVESNEILKNHFIDRYKIQRVLYDEGLNLGKNVDVIYSNKLTVALDNFIARLYDQYYFDQNSQINEEKLNQIIENFMERQDLNEYQISHIYISDNILANEILQKLKSHEITFEVAVEQYSEDQYSKSNQGRVQGGSWVQFLNPDMALAKAVRQLKKSEIADILVKAEAPEYYHIIRLDDKRMSENTSEIDNDKDFHQLLLRDHLIQKLNFDIDSLYNIRINGY